MSCPSFEPGLLSALAPMVGLSQRPRLRCRLRLRPQGCPRPRRRAHHSSTRHHAKITFETSYVLARAYGDACEGGSMGVHAESVYALRARSAYASVRQGMKDMRESGGCERAKRACEVEGQEVPGRDMASGCDGACVAAPEQPLNAWARTWRERQARLQSSQCRGLGEAQTKQAQASLHLTGASYGQ
jgi:hypothetical protein